MRGAVRGWSLRSNARLSVKATVARVRGARAVYGLAAALRAVGLARSTWYYHTGLRMSYADKYAHLEAPLKAIAEARPEYGYRRAATELRETYGHRVNRKVVERLDRPGGSTVGGALGVRGRP